jgi:hypothetical protein
MSYYAAPSSSNGARPHPNSAVMPSSTPFSPSPPPPSSSSSSGHGFGPQLKYASGRTSQKTLVPATSIVSSVSQPHQYGHLNTARTQNLSPRPPVGHDNSGSGVSRTARIAASVSSPSPISDINRRSRPQSAPVARLPGSPVPPNNGHVVSTTSPVHYTNGAQPFTPSPPHMSNGNGPPMARSPSTTRPQSARVANRSPMGAHTYVSSYRPAVASAWNGNGNGNSHDGASAVNQPPWITSGRVIHRKKSQGNIDTAERRRRAQMDSLSFMRNSSVTSNGVAVTASSIAAATRAAAERDTEYHDILVAIKRQLRGHGSQVHRAAWVEYWSHSNSGDTKQRHDALRWLDEYYAYQRERRAARAAGLRNHTNGSGNGRSGSPPPPPLPTSPLPQQSSSSSSSSANRPNASPTRTRTIPFQSVAAIAANRLSSFPVSSSSEVVEEKEMDHTMIDPQSGSSSHRSRQRHRSRGDAAPLTSSTSSHQSPPPLLRTSMTRPTATTTASTIPVDDDLEPFRSGGITDAERLQRDTAIRLESGLPRSGWRPPGTPAHHTPLSPTPPSSSTTVPNSTTNARSPLPPSASRPLVPGLDLTGHISNGQTPIPSSRRSRRDQIPSTGRSTIIGSGSMDDAMSPAPPMNRHVVQSDWSDQMVEIMIRCKDIPNPSLHRSGASSPVMSSTRNDEQHDSKPFSLSVGVFLQERNGEFKLCGYTERIRNDAHPSFRRTFHLPRADYSLRLSLYDTTSTRVRDEQNRLASAVINTRFLLQSKRVEYDLSDVSGEEGMWGKMVVSVVEAATAGSSSDDDEEEPVQQPALPPSLNLYVGCRGLRAAALAVASSSSLNALSSPINNGEMGIAVAFFAKSPTDTRFEFIAQTEVTPISDDPIFEDFFRLPLLPSGPSSTDEPPFEDQTLRFAVYWERLKKVIMTDANAPPTPSSSPSSATKHSLLGSVVVSLRDLLTSSKQQCVFNLFKGGQVIMGQFIVLRKHRRVARKRPISAVSNNSNTTDFGHPTRDPKSTTSSHRRIDMDDNGDIHIHGHSRDHSLERHVADQLSPSNSNGRNRGRQHDDDGNGSYDDDDQTDQQQQQQQQPLSTHKSGNGRSRARVAVVDDDDDNTGSDDGHKRSSPRNRGHESKDSTDSGGNSGAGTAHNTPPSASRDSEPIAILRSRASQSNHPQPVVPRGPSYDPSVLAAYASPSSRPSSATTRSPLSNATTRIDEEVRTINTGATTTTESANARSGSQSQLHARQSSNSNLIPASLSQRTSSNTSLNNGTTNTNVSSPATYSRTPSISAGATVGSSPTSSSSLPRSSSSTLPSINPALQQDQPMSGSLHHHVRGYSSSSPPHHRAQQPFSPESSPPTNTNDAHVSDQSAQPNVHTGRYSLSFQCELPQNVTMSSAPSTYIEVSEIEHHGDGTSSLYQIGQTETVLRSYRPLYAKYVDLDFTAGRDPLLCYTLWQAPTGLVASNTTPTSPVMLARCQAPLTTVLARLREPHSLLLEPGQGFISGARLSVTASEWQPVAISSVEPIWSHGSPLAANGTQRRSSTASIMSSMAVDTTSPRHQQPSSVPGASGQHSRTPSRTLLPPSALNRANSSTTTTTPGHIRTSSGGGSGNSPNNNININDLTSPPGRMGPLFSQLSTDSNATMAMSSTSLSRRPSLSPTVTPAGNGGGGPMYTPYARPFTPPATITEPEPAARSSVMESPIPNNGDTKRSGDETTTTARSHQNAFPFPDGLLPLHQAIRGPTGVILCDTCKGEADYHCPSCQGYNYCINNGCDGHAHQRGTIGEHHERIALRDMPPHLKLMSSYRRQNGQTGVICSHCHAAIGTMYCSTCHQAYCQINGCDSHIHDINGVNRHHQRTPVIDQSILSANYDDGQPPSAPSTSSVVWPPAHGWPDWVARSSIRLGAGQWPCDICQSVPAALRCYACGKNLCLENGCDHDQHQSSHNAHHDRQPLLLFASPMVLSQPTPIDRLTSIPPLEMHHARRSSSSSASSLPFGTNNTTNVAPPGVRSPSPVPVHTPVTTAPPSRQPTPPPPMMVPSPQHNLANYTGARRPSIAIPTPVHARQGSGGGSSGSGNGTIIGMTSGHQLHGRSPSATLSPMGTAKCDNCSKPGAAAQRCGECDRDLCQSCDTSTHKVGRMRGHIRWPYGSEPPADIAVVFGAPAAPPTGSLAPTTPSSHWSFTASGSVYIPPGAIVCDECERAPAVWHCQEHNKNYCEAKKCDSDIHQPEKYKYHHRTRLPDTPASPRHIAARSNSGDNISSGTAAAALPSQPPSHQRRSSISRPEPPSITEMRRASMTGGAAAAAAVAAAMIAAGGSPSPQQLQTPAAPPSHRRDRSVQLVPGQLLCSSCESAPAVWHCIEHDENFCEVNNCDAEQHHHTKYRDHHRDRLPVITTAPSWTENPPLAPVASLLRTLAIRQGQTLCEGCERAPASVFCEECELHLCDVYKCNHEHHTALKKRDHIRRPLPTVDESAPIITPGSAEPSPRGVPSPRHNAINNNNGNNNSGQSSLPPLPSPRTLAPPSHARRDSFIAPQGLSRCDQCEAAIAVWYCPDHNQNFCDDNECDRDAHAPSKLHGHKRVRLPSVSPHASATAPVFPPVTTTSTAGVVAVSPLQTSNGQHQCESCEENPASVTCVECKQVQCNECSNDKHGLPKFKHHRVTPLPSTSSNNDTQPPFNHQASLEPFNVSLTATNSAATSRLSDPNLPLSIDMTGGAGRSAPPVPRSSTTDSPRIGPKVSPMEPLSINAHPHGTGSGSGTPQAVTPIPPSAINIIPPTPLPPTNRTVLPTPPIKAAAAAPTTPTGEPPETPPQAIQMTKAPSLFAAKNAEAAAAAAAAVASPPPTVLQSTVTVTASIVEGVGNGAQPDIEVKKPSSVIASLVAVSAPLSSSPSPPPTSAPTAVPATTVATPIATSVPSIPQPLTKTGVAIGRCDLCESQRAVWSCMECQRDYCDKHNCWSETHSIARMKEHKKVAYDPNKPVAVSTVTAASAPVVDATKTVAPIPIPSATASNSGAPNDVKPPTARQCSNCDTAMAVYYCQDCKADYCTVNNCDAEYHASDKLRSHRRTSIATSPSTQSPATTTAVPAAGSISAADAEKAAIQAAADAAAASKIIPPTPSLSAASSSNTLKPGEKVAAPTTPSNSNASAPVQSIITGKVPVCSICEDFPATIWCSECNNYQCGENNCDVDLHKNAKMSGHKRTPLTITPATSSDKVDASVPAPATLSIPGTSSSGTSSPTVSTSPTATTPTLTSGTHSRTPSGNVIAPSSPSSGGVTGTPLVLSEETTCDNCDEQVATVHCDDCKQNFCTASNCDADMHSNQRTKSHKRQPIVYEGNTLDIHKRSVSTMGHPDLTVTTHSRAPSGDMTTGASSLPAPAKTVGLGVPVASTVAVPSSPSISGVGAPSIVICDNCEDAQAIVYCPDCKQNFCRDNNCDVETHAAGKNKEHKRTPLKPSIGGVPPSPVVAATPAPAASPTSIPTTSSGTTSLKSSPSSSAATTPRGQDPQVGIAQLSSVSESSSAGVAASVACDSCDDAPAMYRCNECKQNLCGPEHNNCEADLHPQSNTRMAAHKRTLLTAPPSASPKLEVPPPVVLIILLTPSLHLSPSPFSFCVINRYDKSHMWMQQYHHQ